MRKVFIVFVGYVYDTNTWNEVVKVFNNNSAAADEYCQKLQAAIAAWKENWKKVEARYSELCEEKGLDPYGFGSELKEELRCQARAEFPPPTLSGEVEKIDWVNAYQAFTVETTMCE